MSAAAHSRSFEGHPEAWRRNLTASEPGVPWVTYYQPESGARVELSRATFDNWVAKAAGLLAEECDVELGTTVLIDLQPHWLLPVWAWASWALGATVVLPEPLGGVPSTPADVCITDNPAFDPATPSGSPTVLLSSRHPMGLPATMPGSPPVPAGVLDALADIRGYPDVRTDPVPPSGQALISDGEQTVAVGSDLTDLLRSFAINRSALLRTRPTRVTDLARALLGPPFHGCGLVIVDGGSAEDVERIRAQEHVDADLG